MKMIQSLLIGAAVLALGTAASAAERHGGGRGGAVHASRVEHGGYRGGAVRVEHARHEGRGGFYAPGYQREDGRYWCNGIWVPFIGPLGCF